MRSHATVFALTLFASVACTDEGSTKTEGRGKDDPVGTYQARAKTAEAKVGLAKGFDGASAYFQDEHMKPGAIELAPHQCPGGEGAVDSGITPPLSVKCSEGPGGRCVPTADGNTGPGYYPISLWTQSEVWSGLRFLQEQGHYFHYRFVADNDSAGSGGYGACRFTVQAFADLDADGIYSTFERAGAADIDGVNAAAGIYIDNEIE
jgi:type IV pilus assembly protein PilA